jgi:hypothetical protein
MPFGPEDLDVHLLTVHANLHVIAQALRSGSGWEALAKNLELVRGALAVVTLQLSQLDAAIREPLAEAVRVAERVLARDPALSTRIEEIQSASAAFLLAFRQSRAAQRGDGATS